jgi:PAS domain S-box-containing protein
MPGLFYFFDKNGRMIRWNENLEKVSGYSSDEIAKMTPLDFFAAEDKELVKNRIQEVFTKGESTVEAYLISKDGKSTPYLFSGLLFIGDKQSYLAGMGIDITERKQAEKEVQKRIKELEEFYDMAVGRELKNIELKKEIKKLKEELEEYKKS